jgi:hypothetical protein
VKDVLAAAAELQAFCERQGWLFCFIGGIAVQRWSRPRYTHDADMTLLTGTGSEEDFVERLLSEFRERSEGEREFALLQRVVRLHSSTGVPLDIALGALPFEERTVERASRWRARGDRSQIITCSAEDLIVHKAFAARGQDWIDLEGVVTRQGPKLNLEQIWTELRPLVELKEEPEILTKLQKIFDQHLD